MGFCHAQSVRLPPLPQHRTLCQSEGQHCLMLPPLIADFKTSPWAVMFSLQKQRWNERPTTRVKFRTLKRNLRRECAPYDSITKKQTNSNTANGLEKTFTFPRSYLNGRQTWREMLDIINVNVFKKKITSYGHLAVPPSYATD